MSLQPTDTLDLTRLKLSVGQFIMLSVGLGGILLTLGGTFWRINDMAGDVAALTQSTSADVTEHARQDERIKALETQISELRHEANRKLWDRGGTR